MKRKMNWIILTRLPFGSILPGLLVAVLYLSCSAPQEKKTVLPAENSSEVIKKNYLPFACFRADTEMEIRGNGDQKLNGRILGDNKKQRMKITLSEPFMGIVVSEVTVAEERVFIDNTGARDEVIPLEKYRMEGLGSQNIRLPFRIVWLLLMGGIPEEIAEDRVKPVFGPEGDLVYEFATERGQFKYTFRDGYIRELYFQDTLNGGELQVTAKGRLPAGPFPETFQLQSSDSRDDLVIHYRSFRKDVSCPDGSFWMPSRG